MHVTLASHQNFLHSIIDLITPKQVAYIQTQYHHVQEDNVNLPPGRESLFLKHFRNLREKT